MGIAGVHSTRHRRVLTVAGVPLGQAPSACTPPKSLPYPLACTAKARLGLACSGKFPQFNRRPGLRLRGSEGLLVSRRCLRQSRRLAAGVSPSHMWLAPELSVV